MEEGSVKRLAGTSMVALAVAAFLASLSLVSIRQREALDTLRDLDSLREEMAMEVGTREELENRIRALEARSRVVREAAERLGMRAALDSEVIRLSGEGS
jgi:cell division protein FtsL